MRRNFFRVQYGKYTLDEMQSYASQDGGDGGGGGLCCCDTVEDLIRNIAFDPRSSTAEVVVFAATRYDPIYDGYRAYPDQILARFRPADFERRAAEIAEQYETWGG